MSLSLKLNSKKIENNGVYKLQEVNKDVTLEFKTPLNDDYTVIFIDYDAPKGIYLHGLLINARDGYWDEVVTTEGPNPPLDEKHHYSVILYRQKSPLAIRYYDRVNFPLTEFTENLVEIVKLDFFVSNFNASSHYRADCDNTRDMRFWHRETFPKKPWNY